MKHRGTATSHRAKPSILRRLVIGLSVVVVVLGIITVATGQAHAAQDSRRCVTANEWSQIHKKMPKSKVERILDGPGFLSYRTMDLFGRRDLWRGYSPCRGFGGRNLFVWYDDYTYGRGFRVWDNYRSENYG